MDRITMDNVTAAVGNLNRRMAARGSVWTYSASRRYDYCALDPIREGSVWGDALICGTKREVYDYVRAMIRAVDDASETRQLHQIQADPVPPALR